MITVPPQPAGPLKMAPFEASSGSGNRSGRASTSSMVFSSGLASARYFGIHQPWTAPSVRMSPATTIRSSASPDWMTSGTRSTQPSGATSGWPFSTIEVSVGTVSPWITSTVQP